MIYLYLWLTVNGASQWVEMPPQKSMQRCAEVGQVFAGPGQWECAFENESPKWIPNSALHGKEPKP